MKPEPRPPWIQTHMDVADEGGIPGSCGSQISGNDVGSQEKILVREEEVLERKKILLRGLKNRQSSLFWLVRGSR